MPADVPCPLAIAVSFERTTSPRAIGAPRARELL